ncbi:MAG TPA: tyrosine-type recombinase/integrase [Chitinophagaceae bacterium]
MHSTQTSIQTFLDYLKFQKRYSQHTIISYENDLKDFFDFIETNYGQLSLTEISTTLVRTWLANLKQNKIVPKSINRKISTLKSFFKYQLRKETIAVSPMATIVSLKVNKRLPSFIEEKDMDTLFQHVEFPDTWEGKTNRLMLQIFYQTGVRLSELINLKESQIDKGYSNLKVLGKRNKERIIPINNLLLYPILEYINAKRNNIEIFDTEYLLISEKGKKLQPKYVYNKVKQYLGYVTTNERKSPHILRHSFATHLTNNGADINAVKELLGHSSLAATQIYTHNSIEKLKDIHKKTHPKS